ncbi:RTC4-like domain-containing protein [Lasiosphaeris hirsuta]|uniref:Restriction of telomere capping protein 4 n=1 Tax=Lasiosphaeris hirsuta TaxID=260670 RepID=A0AA40BBX6_9PEZI|nr:RTC4-like domain-containing protein [Lasiosphaeris hirsuta]
MAAHKQRTAGLTANRYVPPLLKQVNGKIVSGTRQEKLKPEEEPSVDAPPVDFDNKSSSSSSDENGLSSRGTINKQQFKKSTKDTSPQPTDSHRSSRSGSRVREKMSLSSNSQFLPQAWQRPPQRASDIPKGSRMSDMESDLGRQFNDEDEVLKPRLKLKAGYTRRELHSRVRSPNPQRKKTRPPSPSQEDMSSPRKSFNVPGEPLRLESELDNSPKRKFKLPLLHEDSSLTENRPQKKNKTIQLPKRKRKIRQSPEEIHHFPEESQRPMFKIPDLFSAESDLDAGSTVPDREDSPTSVSRRPTSPLYEIGTPSSSRPVCPMCNEDVDQKLLNEFKEKHPRMTLQQEQRFCLLHRKASAKAAWVEKGYPDIKWYALDRRITERYGFLRGILEGGKSHFGEIFGRKVKSGQNKTLLRSEGSLTPGYYGIRGLRAMSENIIREFSSLLRKRSVQDRLVSARGHTAYVQAVLVPELTVQLIMEDMGINQEEARAVLMDSIWVGELLNEEVADVVVSEDESLSDLSDIRTL